MQFMQKKPRHHDTSSLEIMCRNLNKRLLRHKIEPIFSLKLINVTDRLLMATFTCSMLIVK